MSNISVKDKSFAPYISAAQIQARIAEIGRELTEKYAEAKPIIIGILNGSFVFVADMVRALPFELEIEFVKIASYQGTTSTGTTVQEISLKKNITGRTVIILEDIIDSGLTMKNFLETIQAQQPKEVCLVTLLSKPSAHQFKLPIDIVGFEIPNDFVVGYGLDYDGLGRNLDSIYSIVGE